MMVITAVKSFMAKAPSLVKLTQFIFFLETNFWQKIVRDNNLYKKFNSLSLSLSVCMCVCVCVCVCVCEW
jgi:hypothetical protein